MDELNRVSERFDKMMTVRMNKNRDINRVGVWEIGRQFYYPPNSSLEPLRQGLHKMQMENWLMVAYWCALVEKGALKTVKNVD